MISGYCECGSIVSASELALFKKCSNCYKREMTTIKLKEEKYREEMGTEKELKKQRKIYRQRADLINNLNKLVDKTISGIKVKEFTNTGVSERLRSIEIEFSDGSKVAFAIDEEYWSNETTFFLDVEIDPK